MNVSAYIISRNSSDTIESALSSIKAQQYPIEKILLVDDGSTDGRDYQGVAGIEFIKLASQHGRGFARRLAFEKLQSELILSLDAAQQIPPDFVSRAVRYFEDDKAAAVFGQVCLRAPRTTPERWCARHVFRQEETKQRTTEHGASLRTGGALLRREAVLAVGNFNADLVELEDRELGERLLSAGYDVLYDPALAIESIGTITTESAYEKYIRWNQPLTAAPYKVRDALREFSYATKVLAAQDLAAGDLSAAAMSLRLPLIKIMRARRSKNLS